MTDIDPTEPEGLVSDERVLIPDDYHHYTYPCPRWHRLGFDPTEAQKWEALAAIGILPDGESTPLQAWRDAVADATGVPREELDPKHGGALDLGFSPAYVRRFVLALA